MAKFLITGARAPAALELARNFHRHGHQVCMADSLRFPLARGSLSVLKHFYIVSPRKDIKKFTADLKTILISENIDILIPTCEEVFYIAAVKAHLVDRAEIFCPGFGEIKKLHSKFNIYSHLEGTGLCDPGSELVTGEALLSNSDFSGKVVKKEYCRFGTGVWIEPSVSAAQRFVGKRWKDRFVIQNKINGKEYCTYAISNAGEVGGISIYEPAYRISKSAGIYFAPVTDEPTKQAIKNFYEKFCKAHNITGQIGFDLIANDSGVYVLECNPRATSGVHLLAEVDLSQYFLGAPDDQIPEDRIIPPKMVSLGMLLVALPSAIRNASLSRWWRDFQAAQDVVSNKDDRSLWLLSFLSLFEICWIALRQWRSLRSASTYDIEWDGEHIDV